MRESQPGTKSVPPQAAPLELTRLTAVLRALGPASRLWIGYSGGLDSHVLLHACARLRDRLPFPIAAVHLDHGLQPASAHWCEHCRRVCAELGIPLSVRRLSITPVPGESLEAQARGARLATFADLLRPGELVATGQHRDDQAETLLLALLRGSGPRGLAGMAAERAVGAGRLVRPLLDWGRAELNAYARAEGLHWIDDPSNADTDIDRNLLRHQVLPLLRRRWPAADRTIARSARHCADASALLERWADDTLPAIAGSRPYTISSNALLRQDARARRALMRRAIEQQGFRIPGESVLIRIPNELACARADARPLVTWPGCEVRRHRDDIYLIAPLPPVPSARLRWRSGQVLRLPEPLGRIEPRYETMQGAASPQISSLEIRFASAGLPCRGPDGHRRRLKTIWQQAGIPAWLRPYVPVLVDDAGAVLLAGVAACSPAAPAVRWRGHPWERFGLFAAD